MQLDDDYTSYKHVKHGTDKVILGKGESSETGQVLKFLDELGAGDRKKKVEEVVVECMIDLVVLHLNGAIIIRHEAGSSLIRCSPYLSVFCD